MHDTDKLPVAETPQATPPLEQRPLIFTCPHTFEVSGYLIVAIDKHGQPFTNTPPDLSLALHLAQIAVQYTTRQAIMALQAKEPRSSIMAPPPGLTIPPWMAGRS